GRRAGDDARAGRSDHHRHPARRRADRARRRGRDRDRRHRHAAKSRRGGIGVMKRELATRIRELPPYLFADIDRKKVELRKQGKDLIDLGIGDPDLPTPSHIVAAMQSAAAEPRFHRYPSYEGMLGFRQAAVKWYADRFGVHGLDADKECCALIGSKEGIAHFPVAFINPGELVLVPRSEEHTSELQ